MRTEAPSAATTAGRTTSTGSSNTWPTRGRSRLDPAELGLIPVQTAVWGPAIWVNVDRSAPPFSEWTAGLSELVASHGLDVAAHALALEDTWPIEANWKVFLDNAIE